MARPKKWRKVCSLPINNEFGPRNCNFSDDEIINMTVDEYETIRLIDYKNLNQEECGSYMKIARTTVQQIYTEARKKLAISLVEGKVLRIFGGEYTLCDGNAEVCGCGYCRRNKEKNCESSDTIEV